MTTTYAPTLAPDEDELLREALATSERPARPSPWAASMALGWRALLKIKHVPEQMFDVTLWPIVMTLMFVYLFGGALAGSTDAYLHFFIPGILVQTVVMITMYTGSALNADVAKGVFDRFRSLPIWRPSVIVGGLLGDALRYTIASLMVVGLGLVLGFRPAGGIAGVSLSVLLLLVFSFSLSWIWTSLGLMLRTEKAVMGVSMMILFPVTFISNIFVDPATMPEALQRVVGLNPITHLTTAVRGLMDGNLAVREVLIVLAVSAGLIAVFGPITMHRYRAVS